MKQIILAFAVISLAACSPQATQSNFVPQNVLPEALKDCAFFELQNSSGTILRVVRCPSETQKTQADTPKGVELTTINN